MKNTQEMDRKKQLDTVIKSLLQLIKGAKSSEKVSEYMVDERGEKKLKSCKRIVKTSEPDRESIKILLSITQEKDFSKMTDEELDQEKDRLIGLLNEIKK